MPILRLEDEQVDFLVNRFTSEIKEVTEYIGMIKGILEKLCSPVSSLPLVIEMKTQEPRKRKKNERPKKNQSVAGSGSVEGIQIVKRKPGRPPKIKVEEKSLPEDKPAESPKEPIIQKSRYRELDAKKAPVKKTRKSRRGLGRWGGVRLANLSKPLKMKGPNEYSIAAKHYPIPETHTDTQ